MAGETQWFVIKASVHRGNTSADLNEQTANEQAFNEHVVKEVNRSTVQLCSSREYADICSVHVKTEWKELGVWSYLSTNEARKCVICFFNENAIRSE